MHTSLPTRLFAALCLAGLASGSAFATTYTYTGPGAGTATNPLTGSFSVADSWVGDVLPVFDLTTDLAFNFTTGTATAVVATNDLGTITLNSLSVLDNRAALTLTGGILNFVQDTGTAENPTISLLAGNTQIIGINSAITLGANLTLSVAGSGQMQIGNSGTAGAGNIDLGANTLTLTNTSGSSAYQFGQNGGANRAVISGTGAVVISLTNGGATVALFGQSTYSGGTTLNNGFLVIGSNSVGTVGAVTSGSLGTGLLTINGGSLRATSTAPNSRTFLNDVAANGNFTIGDGTTTGLIFGGNMTLGGNRTITVTGGGTAADLTTRHAISGAISDGGNGFSFTKTGAGTLILTGANTYTGTTNVLNTALVIGANALVNTPGPLGNASSAISLGGAGAAAGNSISLLVGVPGATPGAATITLARDITVGNVNSSGTTSLGTLSDTDAVFSGGIALSKSVQLSSLSTGTRAATFSGVISGGFGVTKINAGIARLSGVNTYTGTTTVRNGTLLVAGDVAAGNDGPLGNAAGAVLLADATSGAADNIVLGIDGAFTIARDVTVNANNTTGTSTLTAFNANATYAGTVTLNKNVVLANATVGATTLFSGAVTDGAGAFGVTINGPGIVEFGGAGVNSYDGGTTVASGTLRLNRNFGGNDTLTGPVTIGGGTLQLAGADQLPDALVLNMSSGTFDVGGFAETITDLNYTGGTILNGGLLTLTASTDLFLFDASNVAAPASINRHILYLGSTTAATVNAALALDNDATHDLSTNDGAAAEDVIFNAAITNDGTDTPTTLIKKGAGTVRFTVANTFGGAGKTLELQGGTVIATADDQLGHAANTVTLNGGALRFGTAFATTRTFVTGATLGALDVPTGVVQTLAGTGQISGSANFAKTGAGELIISGDNSASFSGSAVASGGTLTVGALNNLLGNTNNDLTLAGGTFRTTGSFAFGIGQTINLGAGGGTFQIDAGQTVDLPSSGGLAGNTVLTKTGDGTLRIGAANVGLVAGAGVNIAAGTVDLRDAGSLGTTPKAVVTLSGGTLSLVSDAATGFANPVVVAANSTVSADRANSGAGVVHTLGTLSLGAATLTGSIGANQTGTTGGVTFGAATLTGNGTLAASAGALLTTGTIALGTNTLTVDGAGTVTTGTLSGGPGAGNTAAIKNGGGVLVIPASAGSFTGNTIINGGILRMNSIGSLGNNLTNTITVNAGGTLGLGSNGYASNPLFLNGGTVAGTGRIDATWTGLAGPTPSVTFTADTVFNLWDAITPTTDADVNFGTTNTGVPTSTVPVNITVNANASNTTSIRKLRFQNMNDSGSVTGTLTVNPNAIAQIRSGGTTNALGSGVLIRLNTGLNLVTPTSSGRFEYISEVDSNFGNDMILLGDSTIAVGRITGGTGRLMTGNNLSIGAFTLAVVDSSGAGVSNYNLAFSGTTTLTGSPTFANVRALTLANITDGADTFGLTKIATGVLTINGGGYNGPTLINAGTLAFGPTAIAVDTVALTGSGVLNITAGGTLTTTGVNINSTAGSTVNGVLAGTGGIIKTGAGALTLGAANTFAGDVFITASGNVTTTADNAIPATANVSVNGSRLDFLGRNATVASLTYNGITNATAGIFTSTLAAAPTLVVVTGDIALNGDSASGSPALTVNSGNMGASLSTNAVHIFGGTTNVGTGALLIGSMLPGSSITIGAGGLDVTTQAANYNAIFINNGTGLGKVILNGNLTLIDAGHSSTVSFASQSTTAGQLDLAAGVRDFTIADGGATTDLGISIRIANGGIVKKGPGTLALTSTLSSYTGGLAIQEGIVSANSDGALGGFGNVVTFTGNTTLLATANFVTSKTFALGAGGGTIDTGFTDLTLDATSAIGGSTLNKIGDGSLTIGGTQAYLALNATAGITTLASSLPAATINNIGGTLNLLADATASIVNADANTNFGSAQTLAALHVGAAGFATISTHSGSITPLDTDVLTIATGGKLDITNNALVVRGGDIGDITDFVTSGSNGLAWNGLGINSNAAAVDANFLTGIGVIDNAEYGYTDFANVTGLTGDEILVKYTYYGDSDLSGQTTADDFTLFFDGFTGAQPASWLYGDYDYDGAVTVDDFTLFVSALNSGGPVLAPDVGAPAAVPEPGSLALLLAGALGLLGRRR